MAHTVILSIQSQPSQSLADLERGETTRMECSFEVNHEDSPEEVGRKAGKRIARMLRVTGHSQAHDHNQED